MTLWIMNIIHLNNEKTMSDILCSSSLLGWITASDINHSYKGFSKHKNYFIWLLKGSSGEKGIVCDIRIF